MKLQTVATAIAGSGAIEVVKNVDLDQVQQGAGLLMQIIIGVATLIQLFKKKKA